MKHSFLSGVALAALLVVSACDKKSTPEPRRAAATATADASTSTVTINCPNSFTVGRAATFSGTASADVFKVIVSVDGFVIKDMPVTNGAYSFSYAFSAAGQNRRLVVNAFSAAGVSLVQTSKLVNVVNSAPYVQGVPYFYQYSNRVNPDGSCQNTSMAMILKYHGINITPDNLSNEYGTSAAQSVSGFQQIFNAKAAAYGLRVRDNGSTQASVAQMRAELAAGRPVVVHGYFTSYGHVMVVLGFDGTYYYCNDPAGRWSQQYKYGGYSQVNATEGIAVRYSRAAFESAVSPDGYVWLHRFTE